MNFGSSENSNRMQTALQATSLGLKVVSAVSGGGVVAGGTAGAAGGAGAISGILGAAGVSATVPIAGWIVAGGLLTAAAITGIVIAVRKKGRKAATAYAESLGAGGKAFISEFAANADKPTPKVKKQQEALAARIAGAKARGWSKREATLADRYNANAVLLAMRQAQPAQPAIAGEQSTVPVVVEAQSGGDSDMLLVGGVLGLAALIAIIASRK
jgi:hypothetical protein